METDVNEFSIGGQSSPRYIFSGGVHNGVLSLNIDDHYSGTRVRGFGCGFNWNEILSGRRCSQTITLSKGLEYIITLRLIAKRALRLEIKIDAPDGTKDRFTTPIRKIEHI